MARGSAPLIQIEGLLELIDMLENLAPKEVKNLLRGTNFAVARKVRDTMKRRVKKRSHDLEQSIFAVRRRGTESVVYADVRMRGTPHSHGLMLEHGTRKTKAQPFIVPSVEEIRGQVPEIYRTEFGERLEKTLAKMARK